MFDSNKPKNKFLFRYRGGLFFVIGPDTNGTKTMNWLYQFKVICLQRVSQPSFGYHYPHTLEQGETGSFWSNVSLQWID